VSTRRSLAAISALLLTCSCSGETGSENRSGNGDPGGGDTDPGGDNTTPASGPSRYPIGQIHAPLSASVLARVSQIVATTSASQADVFMKTGGTTSASNHSLTCFAGDRIDLGAQPQLQAAIDHFLQGDAGGSDPFSRQSLAADAGREAGWAITGANSPVNMEVAATNPRFAVVDFGNADMQFGASFADALLRFGENYWQLVDTLADSGVVPVVVTMMPRSDVPSADLWVPTYNLVIRAIAQGRQVPFVDLHLAVANLPNRGLSPDGVNPNFYSPAGVAEPCLLTSAGLEYGYNMRNAVVLEALERMRTLATGTAVAENAEPAVSGSGSALDPFQIQALPFVHMADTTQASDNAIDSYGCAPASDLAGPEHLYRLTLATATTVRVVVIDKADADVALFVMPESADPAACTTGDIDLVQGTWPAGGYTLAVDTRVRASDGAELAGEYALAVLVCEPGDPDC